MRETDRVFAVLRTAATGRDWVLCLHNVTNERLTLKITTAGAASAEAWTEMLCQRPYPVSAGGTISVTLRPYEVNWLAAQGPRPLEIVMWNNSCDVSAFRGARRPEIASWVSAPLQLQFANMVLLLKILLAVVTGFAMWALL